MVSIVVMVSTSIGTMGVTVDAGNVVVIVDTGPVTGTRERCC
jgi:hypothetical protein